MSSLDSVPISSVMVRPVKTVRENDTVQRACEVMIQNKIGSVIVEKQATTSNAMPVGIVTERDIVRCGAERPISFKDPIDQIMSKPIVTIHPNGSLRDALQTMQSRDIRRLIVATDNASNMVGIITDKDIIRFIARNQSVASTFVNEQVLARNREMAEQFSTSLLDDLIYRRN